MLRLLCVTGGILLIAGGISAHNAPHASGQQASGQQPLLPHVAPDDVQAQASIEAGLKLEEQLRWADGIQHYESALRQHVGNATLQQRLLICRLHHDVQRRYQDKTFVQTLSETSTQQALDLYGEMLANMETHYVDGVDWKKLIRHGSASLEVALTEPLFIKRVLPGASPDAIERFRQNVHVHVVNREVNSRHDLRAIAAQVANLAKQEVGLPGTVTVFEFACGSLSALDIYSRFLTAGQLDETFSSIEGNFVGLGVELKADADRLMILSVIPGGPAAQAGLVPGDAIVKVDQTSTAEVNPDYAADLLRGPEGSLVSLSVIAADGSQRSLQVSRRRVDVPCVENVHMVDADAGIGYLRLTNFQKTTTREVEKALWDLHRLGMKSLIIDVRGNPGGLLSAAVEVADRFIPTGRIVTTRGRNTRENFDYTAHRPNTWNVPMAVLIDSDSASASEIFAGAIHDHHRGRLVGQRSYGKGSVQGIFRMQSAKCGLCLTTAKFYSPSGQGISDRGVHPDIAAEPTYIAARPNAKGEITRDVDDNVLQQAVQSIRGESRLSSLPR
jgi:carboxyl-terminal processing protease